LQRAPLRRAKNASIFSAESIEQNAREFAPALLRNWTREQKAALDQWTVTAVLGVSPEITAAQSVQASTAVTPK